MRASTILAISLILSACSSIPFPGVHRINIQQGNVISQTMIDKLRPGMTKSQVRFVLGNPMLDDQLNQDRWNYVYSLKIGGGKRIQKQLVMHFSDGRLSHFEGDYLPTSEKKVHEPIEVTNR
ncbi:MAG: outer membrane protein assembly factor BamE [Pseudomonadales bacterium]